MSQKRHSQFAFSQRVVPIQVGTAKALGVRISKQTITSAAVDVDDAWVETTLGNHWTAAFRLTLSPLGQPVVAEVRVFPAEKWSGRRPGTWSGEFRGVHAKCPGSGITKQLLKEVSLGAPSAHVRRFLVACQAHDTGLPTAVRERFGFSFEKKTPRKTDRRRRADALPDIWFATVAKAYVEACAAGRNDEPVTEQLGKKFGRSRTQIRDDVRGARTRKFLTPALKQGVQGGQLTPRGERALREIKR